MSRTTELAELRRSLRSGEAKKIRQDAAVSQSEMARDIGVTPGAFSHWESGTRTPTGDAAIRYLRLLRRLQRVEATA